MSGRLRHAVAYAALLALLALTTGSAFVDLGTGNIIANLAIAGLKAALIVLLVFMEFARGGTADPAVRAAVLLWLAILSA